MYVSQVCCLQASEWYIINFCCCCSVDGSCCCFEMSHCFKHTILNGWFCVCRQWVASLLVCVKWELGAALMSSTVWRSACCQLCRSRFKPFRKPSRNLPAQTGKTKVWMTVVFFPAVKFFFFFKSKQKSRVQMLTYYTLCACVCMC